MHGIKLNMFLGESMAGNNKTFFRITNKHIYEKIEELIDHVKTTNGRVKLNRWIGTTALTLGILNLTKGFIL